MAFTAQRLRGFPHHFTGAWARAGKLASGVPEFCVPYSTCSCNLATGNVGPLHGQPQQLRPSSQMRLARIQPGRVC